jgi:hypothetical protein
VLEQRASAPQRLVVGVRRDCENTHRSPTGSVSRSLSRGRPNSAPMRVHHGQPFASGASPISHSQHRRQTRTE